eukprot:jgi/Ulvmu1/3881/UM018_0102.1
MYNQEHYREAFSCPQKFKLNVHIEIWSDDAIDGWRGVTFSVTHGQLSPSLAMTRPVHVADSVAHVLCADVQGEGYMRVLVLNLPSPWWLLRFRTCTNESAAPTTDGLGDRRCSSVVDVLIVGAADGSYIACK